MSTKKQKQQFQLLEGALYCNAKTVQTPTLSIRVLADIWIDVIPHFHTFQKTDNTKKTFECT